MKRIVTLFSFFLLSIFISHAQYVWVGNNSYGGYSLPNNITIAASAPNCFIGGLNTSGTNSFAGDIVLNSSTQFESFVGGIAQFTGNKSGPHGITIDDVGESGNGIVQYSGLPKTYTGITTINNGVTLRISSNQSLDDIVLNTGGKLIVDAGVKLTVNGSWTGGGELENYGTIELRDNVNFPGTGTNVTAMNILQINRNGNVYLDNNIIITGSLILTLGNFNINPSVRLTLNGASLVNDAGVLVGSSTSDITVCGITGGTVLINSAVTLRNISVEGTRVLSLNGSNNLSLHGLLTISPFAKFNTGGDASQIINVGAASVDISGTFITQHPGGFVSPGSAIPGNPPYVLNVGCTIEYGRLGNQSVQGSIVGYKNLTLSGNGTKLLESGTNPVGLVSIKDNATFDVRNFTFGDVSTNLQMDGGRFRVDGVGTKPEIGGTYTLNDGVIEFYNSNTANNQTIKGISPTSGTILYKNIEVTGNKVGQSSNNISLGNSGRFTIKPFGVYESNANGISGPSFNNQSVIVENNGIFKTGNLNGFSGGTTTSIRNSIETVDLQTGSKVIYARSNPPLSNGEQFITNAHTYQHLELSGTGIKTAPSATLAIQGNLTQSGSSTFAHNNGLVLLNGASQSFAGFDFYGLELTGGTKTTNGDASIDSVITINSNAVLNISNGDSITLKSGTTRTARIDQLLHADPSAAITYNGTGKFVVERSLYTGRKWRLLSAPTHGQSIRDSWQERGTNVSGNVSGYGLKAYDTRPDWEARGFDGLGGGTSIKKYSPLTNTWDAIERTHSSINAERGYLVFVSGDFSANYPNSNATKLRTSGKLFTGDSTIKIPRDTFALIGNPYASRIDLRNLNFTGFDPLLVAQTVYVWDPAATGVYGLGAWRTLVYDGTNYETAEEGVINNFIESGQAFFVKGGVGTNYITFQENDKTDEVGNTMSSFTAGASQSIRAVLNLVPATGSPIVLDGVKADFGENYSNSINGYDIKKMGTINESVSWKTKDSILVVDRRAMIVNNDTLHLNNRNYKLQNYQWKITSNNLDFPGRTGFLVDRYTGTVTPLDMAGTTTINFSVQNIAGSYAADRFKIVFNQVAAGPLPVTITAVTANRNADRSVAVQWKVVQEINIVAYEVERSNNGSNFTPVHNRAAYSNNSNSVTYDFTDLRPFSGDNFYRIKAISIGGQVQYSNVVRLNGSKATSLISVYPNPVINKQLHLRFEEQGRGRYHVQLMNMKSQVLVNKTVNVLKAVQTETIELLASLSAGIYQLLVITPNGISTIQKVLIQ